MGLERILQAARRVGPSAAVLAVFLVSGASATNAHAAPREKVAIIDLGPSDGTRLQLAATVDATDILAALAGGGLEEALSGKSVEPDADLFAASMATAQNAFGALDCSETIAAAKTVIGIAAARHAAGLPVPELVRALTYVLLCADRTGDTGAAMTAAARLRTLGGSSDVPADLWAKYPDVDALLAGERFEVEISSDVTGAVVWIDFERIGTAPVRVQLPAGEHVIAAAAGNRRGWAAGTVVKSQPTVTIGTVAMVRPHQKLADRIARLRGALPSAVDLGEVMTLANTRIAIVRKGDSLQAWGRVSPTEAPHLLGGEDGGTGSLEETDRIVRLVVDRVQAWNDRTPDPDQPLLLEDPKDRTRRNKERKDEPTKWWVYAAIGGAIVAGGIFLIATETANDVQHVELHAP